MFDGEIPFDGNIPFDGDIPFDGNLPDSFVPPECGNGEREIGEQCDDDNSVTEPCAYGERSCTICDRSCRNADGLATYCGDGTRQEDEEQCDDGNNEDNDGCSAECESELCGDGVPQSELGEECDDGNDVNADGCDENCTESACGNGVTAGDEACDDGNDANADACDSNCTLPACGNGVMAASELCDDGNDVDDDGCDSNCTVTGCGNGVMAGDEVCDDGNLISGDGCDANCTLTMCGNNIQTNDEECEDGNVVSDDGCDANCTITGCGNGIVTALEVCDDGNDVDGDGCDNDCSLSTCGDGIPGVGEECDDDNFVQADGCDNNCTISRCGNGVHAGSEVCDDGNTASGDGCDSNCTVTACGNDVVAGEEDCDDNNLTDGDGCDSNCTVSACGNGIRTGTEQCDDGNDDDGDGCNGCVLPDCGDEQVEGDEACDDGNEINGDGCDINCTVSVCGNDVAGGDEECDDGDAIEGNGCDTNCTISACGNGITGGDEECDELDEINGDGCDTNCTLSVCGNGIAAGDEACDDGNEVNGDGCDTNCTLSVCGNGITGGDEQCDELNEVNGDGCDTNCTLSVCGNGIAAGDEECDEPNEVDGDGCDTNCTFTGCGNGIETGDEACDDGNEVNGDGCDTNCTVSVCGNGITGGDEECDELNEVDGDGCDVNCTFTGCGNGIQTEGEVCDDGDDMNGDECDNNCTEPSCGNGETGGDEECDELNEIDGDGCDTNCTLTACGNGIRTGEEACDDGAGESGDGCSPTCSLEYCGDGVQSVDSVQAIRFEWLVTCAESEAAPFAFYVNEQIVAQELAYPDSRCTCDPGIQSVRVTDPAVIADVQHGADFAVDTHSYVAWVVAVLERVGSEERVAIFDAEGGDDGLEANADLCDSEYWYYPEMVSTFAEYDSSEECEDGNTESEDGCSSGCVVEYCGDGITQAGMGEGCDDGNEELGDGCTDECVAERCGDGEVNNRAAVTSATLEWVQTCADSEPFTFSVNGTLLYDGTSGEGCNCEDPGIQTAEITDPERLAAFRDGTNAVEAFLPGASLWAVLTVRLTSGSQEVFIFDPEGQAEDRDAYFCESDGLEMEEPVVDRFELSLPPVEQCDDGNDDNGDGCDNNCTASGCGNGEISGSEECDDGNTVTESCAYGGEACTVCGADCTEVEQAAAYCGNGQPDASPALSVTFEWMVGCETGGEIQLLVNGDVVASPAVDPDNGCDCVGNPQLLRLDDPAVLEKLVTGGNELGFDFEDGGEIAWAVATIETASTTVEVVMFDADGDSTSTGGDGDGDGGEPAPVRDPYYCDGSDYGISETAAFDLTLSEACDDGNEVDGDDCDTNCTFTACGNDIITEPETCDDGNLFDSDGCDSNCTPTGCGNEVISRGEECDDANDVNGDGCDNNCTESGCGNGIITEGEECDTDRAELSIDTLSIDDCTTVDHDFLTGDDRGGIAAGGGYVLYTGDNGTATFDTEELSGTYLERYLDAMVSDLKSNRVLSLGNGGEVLGGGGSVTSLLTLDPSSGDVIDSIELSQEIGLSGDTGIFSGYGFVALLYGGTVYEIDTDTGIVTTHEMLSDFDRNGCENWAYWGVAEKRSGELWLAYVEDSQTISRVQVSTGVVETILSIDGSLSDMCSFTVSPRENRWYFHHEGGSSLGSGSEVVGHCSATLTINDAQEAGCDAECQVLDGYTCEGEPSICATSCGDQIVAGEEECEEENEIDGDGCDSNCTFTACGNGVLTGDELCDDGNTINGDGCDDNCEPSACGNGALAPGEECDDDNDVDGDGCDSNCTYTGCTNGIASDGEDCDDGNDVNGDGCDNNCTASGCGNGIVAPNEDCETPGANGCNFACNFICASGTGAAEIAVNGSSCYARYATVLGFNAAEQACVGRGGHLAVPSSQAENDIISGVRDGTAWTWIGLHDQTIEAGSDGALYVTVTGEPNVYTNFSPGEPNDSDGLEDCAHQWNEDGTWNDWGCDNQAQYVCELPYVNPGR